MRSLLTIPPAILLMACATLLGPPSGLFAAPAGQPGSPGEPLPAGSKTRTEPGVPGGTKAGGADSRRSISEINRIWMRELHGKGTAPDGGKSSGAPPPKEEPGGRGRETRSGDPVRLANPGVPNTTGRSRLFDQKSEETSFVSVVVRFIGILALMLGGFYVFVRYVRQRGGSPIGGHDLVQVIASVPLIQGKFLQIVDMAGRLMVLGVSEQGVTLLSDVDDARTADRIRLWQSQSRRVPEVARGALGSLTTLLRGVDFRFWNAAGEGRGESRSRDSFREVLRGQGGSVAGAGALFAGSTHEHTSATGSGSTGLGGHSSGDQLPSDAEEPSVRRSDDGDRELPGSAAADGRPTEARDLFDFAIPPETEADDVDEKELHEMLKRQRRRLESLKTRPRE